MEELRKSAYDAIVIGSGIGGMAAAAALAKLAGYKVLVLERHTELGGQTHEFRRNGFSWDVGLHYVGDMEEGGLVRRLMDTVTGGKLAWLPLPREFERFSYPGFDFSVPSDEVEYRERLERRYPAEAASIRRYFADIRATAAWHGRDFVARFAPAPIAAALRLANIPGARRATMTTRDYLDRRFADSELKAVLSSQWGDYGLPPAESAFAVHALIVNHYLRGASFPEGGAGRIARLAEKVIEEAGGACRTGFEVREILVRAGRVVGVKAAERFAPGSPEIEFLSDVVISDVGVRNTFGSLLRGAEGSEDLRKAEAIGRGHSAVTLYLGLKESPEKLGIRGENWWIFEGEDYGDVDGASRDLLRGNPRGAYLSFPSLKRGRPAGDAEWIAHTAEVISFVGSDAFAPWADTEPDTRGTEYRELKDTVAKGLLDLVERRVPGFRDLVAYAELSTPLSVINYTRHPGGSFYGLPATPERYRSGGFSPKTNIRGLFLSGSDVSSLGIVGALTGGIAAASAVMGPAGFFATFGGQPRAVAGRAATGRHGASTEPEAAPTKRILNRSGGRVVAKTELSPLVWRLDLEVEDPPASESGQFARIRVSDTAWRDYSIVENRDGRVSFIIAARTGGLGSRFIRGIGVGESVDLELPYGEFLLAGGGKRKVFVATGTGLAPALSMLGRLAETGFAGKVDVLFGCPRVEDDFASALLRPLSSSLDLTTTICLSRETAAPSFAGRVTAALERMDFDPENTEFYLAGNPRMIEDARKILDERGARFVRTERY